MLELTVEELVTKYPNLMVDSTRESIINNNYKLRTSVKEALITQLECCYENVEYIAGRKGVPTMFKLSNPKKLPDEYLGSTLGGRQEIDFSEEFRLLDNWVSDIRPLYDEKNIKKNRRFTASKIVNEAFNLKDLDTVLRILLLETKNKFKAPTYLKTRGYNQTEYSREQLLNQSKELSRMYMDTLRRLQKQMVERWLEKNKATYNEVYMAKNGKNFNQISQEVYNEYKEFESCHRELSANLNMKQKNIDKNLKRLIKKKFEFEFAYTAYEFYNNKELQNDDNNLLVCRNNLYSRLIETAERANVGKVYPENWRIEADNLSIRLKRMGEFKDFSEIVWSVVFNKLENEKSEITALIQEVNRIYNEQIQN